MALTYLAASSLASFVTIHAQWANPPWLTRLTLLPPSSVHSSPQSKRSLRSPTDTITQSANDDGDDADDSLLLNLTPLNCRSSEDEIPGGHKLRSELFQSAADADAAFSISVTQTHNTRRDVESLFRFFLPFVLAKPEPRRSSHSRLDSGTEMLGSMAARRRRRRPTQSRGRIRQRARERPACACLYRAQAVSTSTHGAPAPTRGRCRTDRIGPRAPVPSGAEAACATNTVTSHNAAAALRSFF